MLQYRSVLRFACAALTFASAASVVTFAQTAATVRTNPGFDRSAMDTTADPCVDFYKYACGNYAKQHPISADLPASNQFTNLYEFNQQALHGLLDTAAAAHGAPGSDNQKIGDYYSSCMATDRIEKAGLAPIQPELDRIAALRSATELPPEIAHLGRLDVNVFLSLGPEPDFKNAGQEIAAVDQGGLGLPEKDYYLRTGAQDETLRQQYKQHIANVLKLLGEPPADVTRHADAILAFETSLAKLSMGNVERRNPDVVYHKEPLAKLAADTPNLHMSELLKAAGVPAITDLNVANPGFFAGLDPLLTSTDLDTLKAYMRVHLVDAFASQLPKAFDDEQFDFYSHKLQGIPEQQARWKRCVDSSDKNLGELLGKSYVAKYFPGDSKARTSDEVRQIGAAMNHDLDQLTWMSPATRAKAHEKLAAVVDKIGYPSKWRDYSSLQVAAAEPFSNTVHAREFNTDYELHKIGKPVDKLEWGMTPPTVNAYYDPTMNDINFPAGILQPSFYDRSASDATNYGHIGAVVGHELTHGFDDEGRKFDAQGNLRDWWTPEDAKQFDERTDCVVKEYSSFVAVDDLHVNGKLTLGENTADNGGLRLAWMALVADAAQHGRSLDAKDQTGYTPKQEIFLGWAQNWCSDERPELLRLSVQTDPHSPDALRVKGVILNMPEFAQTFGCKVGQPMAPAPAQMCRVW